MELLKGIVTRFMQMSSPFFSTFFFFNFFFCIHPTHFLIEWRLDWLLLCKTRGVLIFFLVFGLWRGLLCSAIDFRLHLVLYIYFFKKMKIKINGLFDFAYRFLLIFTNILSHCGRWPFQTKERRYTHTHTHTHTHRKVNRKHVWPPEGPRCRFPKEESLILFFFWFFFFIKEKSR